MNQEIGQQWREVDSDLFYEVIGPQNCHPTIITQTYPYVSEWRLLSHPTRMVIGKSHGNRYYLPVRIQEAK